ncbi:hypothetical protein PPL_11299 [Heterostelium album PN500]|uniref:CCZ1/INTU/HSP4 first Longin domain-containing protein n=1 Tax=Heterostelium pallidum (strain ATCC 26659 / Pp 5 / PN500) TaxID=670386 RepID=D3BU38_HETP5|nr:hypothetical protein PPL_11299 [Heterostelium album PN500]EFA75224.1 hypothetical protein PPL_11299 [Heterostelium album PN500]|eukprot:XP_020427358.1 hypothetical protein PPL_11299 [Heterostelium album PN500]
MSGTIEDASLHYFYIFNPKLGQKEGREHEKILYFYPQANFSIGIQTNFVGLTEAYVLCTKQFSPDKPCEAIHTMKHTIALRQVEPDIWMVIALNNTSGVVNNKKEYLENEIDDIILQTTLQQLYDIWRLFNGPMSEIVKRTSYDHLKKRLDAFIKPYLEQIAFDQLDLFTSLDGIQFLPVDKNVYLKLLAMINGTEIAFQSACPSFRFGALYYKDNLLWSSLQQNHIRSLNHYLIQLVKIGVDRSAVNSIMVINTGDHEVVWSTKGQKSKSGYFTESMSSVKTTLPVIHIGEQLCYMIIYEQRDTVCVFLVNEEDLDQLKLEEVRESISSHIDYIYPVLETNYSKKSFMEEQYKYIFFNQMNLAIKASLKLKGVELTKETLKILNEMHADFENRPDISESTVKTQNDRWIVGRKTDSREFYVIFDTKTTSLLEINGNQDTNVNILKESFHRLIALVTSNNIQSSKQLQQLPVIN